MNYKIYRLTDPHENQNISSNIRMFIEDDELNIYPFDSMEDALEKLNRDGESYIHYTILPYIFMI